MAGAITGTPKVDMLLGVTARKAGKSVESLVASRHVLDVDEGRIFYSTDFPTGGSEKRDYNENEIVRGEPDHEPRRLQQGLPLRDADLRRPHGRGTKNTALQAPWSFDANDGALPRGTSTPESTDLGAPDAVANWGEDTNFNNLLGPGEDRDRQQRGPRQELEHPGRLRLADPGRQPHGRHLAHGRHRSDQPRLRTASASWSDTIAGTNGVLGQWEMLITPVVQKVNTGVDAEGEPTHQVEFTNWAWNMEMDLATEFDLFLWELDTNTQSVTRADLFNDQIILNFLGGNQGALSGGNSPLTNGFQVFAPFNDTSSVNGIAGNNRVGKNACIFENAGTAGRSSTAPSASPSPRTGPTAWPTTASAMTTTTATP